VNAIVRSGTWGREERLFLESAVVLATAPPLCLEPHPAVGLLAARLHHQRHLLATPDIRRQARRYSQVAINRKRKLDQLSHHHGLRLLDLISKQRAKQASNVRHTISNAPLPRASSKFPKKPCEVVYFCRLYSICALTSLFIGITGSVGASV
jgi:transcription factor SPT20 homolog